MSFSEFDWFCHPKFVAIRASKVVGDGLKGITCIFAPNDLSDKVTFFNVIIFFIQNWVCRDFIIFGDLNSILHGEEHWGSEWVQLCFKEIDQSC